MKLMPAIDALIREHGSASILKDHLALVREQAQIIEKENERLVARVTDLEEKCRTLSAQVEAQSAIEQFIEHRGVLLKKRPSGGFHDALYCPKCQKPLGAMEPFMSFACTQTCGFVSSHKGRNLSDVLGSAES